MRRALALLLAVMLLIGLSACAGKTEPETEQAIVRKPKETAAKTETEETQPEKKTPEAGFASFQYGDVTVRMGDRLDLSVLPEAVSVYEAPSCAIEGMDLVYTYADIELSAYDEGTGPVISSVYFLSPDAATPEGLTLGDGKDRILALYGENYSLEGSTYSYTAGNTALNVTVQNDAVIGIEYRLLTP